MAQTLKKLFLCTAVRISALLRTAKAFDVKKIDLFCAIVV